jgi:hypothetical protein
VTNTREERTSVRSRSAEDPVAPRVRGPRPFVIELASAALIVTGAIGFFGSLSALSGAFAEGAGGIGIATAALNVASFAVGLLVRYGRAWVLDVNFVAVVGFLDVMAAGAGDQVAALLAIVDVFVFIAVFVQRPWFER